jgi:hypothetical protein
MTSEKSLMNSNISNIIKENYYSQLSDYHTPVISHTGINKVVNYEDYYKFIKTLYPYYKYYESSKYVTAYY